MTLSKIEQETIILYNEEEKTATVNTCNKSLIKRLDGFCAKSALYSLIKSDEYSKTYIIPKKYISIRFAPVITDEKRAKMALNAKDNFSKTNNAAFMPEAEDNKPGFGIYA